MPKFVWVILAFVPLLAQDQVDLSIVNRIRTEAFENSKVMDHLSYMTDMYGPRLTGSPEFKQAADWALKRLQDYGLVNGHLEKWGPFGRSWTLEKFSVELLEPRYSLLSAWPLAWSQGTNGPVSGEVILTPAQRSFDLKKGEADLEAYKKKYAGKLRGKIVMVSPPITDVLRGEMRIDLQRYTAAALAELAAAPQPVPKVEFDPDNLIIPEDPEQRGRLFSSLPMDVLIKFFDRLQALRNKRNEFLSQEGAIGILQDDERAHDSLLFAEAAGSYKAKDQLAPPTFVLTAEHYNRIARLVEKKVPVRLQLNLQAKASDADVDAYNVVAEIPGGAKKDEIVMLGAHFDSWHSGTGATDNASGSAVMMEVVRILKTLNLKMDRTVRIALWSGEEEGLLGSKAYVKEHFADPATMQTTTAHAHFSGYFNLDNGSGKIRGVYLQNDDAMRPLFERWLKPFEDLGVTTVSIRNTGGTDHLSFDAVGLPGFQFIQDPLDYSTVTHHSSMDVFDHAIAADLMQASAVIASCVYEAAARPEKLPRKPLPKVKPAAPTKLPSQ
ncbi:MAG: M20/M25/M40 family metallo-hydrolase [Bryobacteraceae bacterium]